MTKIKNESKNGTKKFYI